MKIMQFYQPANSLLSFLNPYYHLRELIQQKYKRVKLK